MQLGSSRTLPSFVYLHRAGRRAAGDEAVKTFLKSGHEKTDCWNYSLARYVRAQQLWSASPLPA